MTDDSDIVSEVIDVRNIHCSACVRTISSILLSLLPPPTKVETSITGKTVRVVHSKELTRKAICSALKHGGFEPVDTAESAQIESKSLLSAEYSSKPFPFNVFFNWNRERHHRQFCQACQTEHLSASSKRHESILSGDSSLTRVRSEDESSTEFRALFSIGGMSCASCSNAITAAVKDVAGVIDFSVDLLGNSATAILASSNKADIVKESIEDIGYDCDIVEVVPVQRPSIDESTWKVIASIGGMSCASCVNALTEAFKSLDFVLETNITLLTNSGTFIVNNPNKVDVIRETIEDVGYECGDISIVEDRSSSLRKQSRMITIRIDGMYCEHCPQRINDALKEYEGQIEIHSGPVTRDNNIIRFSYIPSIPNITARAIVKKLSSISPEFTLTIVHAPTLEERALKIALKERKRLILRMVLSIVCAIPTFILGVVMMMILPSSNHYRQYVMEPIWAGRAARGVWALLFPATVVYFFAADIFHIKAIKEVRSLWRPGVPFTRRLFRFGSMNLLMSLGTSVAYFASIALLILEAVSEPEHHMDSGYSTTFFDSVVFLTMFLLVGRILEAFSKSKTASAVSMLSNLRPKTALLMDTVTGETKEISVEFLEVGDIVRVLSGMSPPSDGVVISGKAEFNEAALNGESLPVEKTPGDRVFAGTNHCGGEAILMEIDTFEGDSMLDQITNVVRQGQTKRAPIERISDVLTGYFVPVVTLIAVMVFVIWLALGESGSLPADYLDIDVGGWPVWSIEFAISVFVVACPCGIGLAAPTALFVGTGLAAKYGILPRGGGEAFQEGAQVDVVVFDKTGTLTEGGQPKITDVLFLNPSYRSAAIQIARDLELNSTHPLARSIIDYAEKENAQLLHEGSEKSFGSQRTDETERSFMETVNLSNVQVSEVSEIAGRGLKGRIDPVTSNESLEAIIGNEKWMNENGAFLTDSELNWMQKRKEQGESVILLGTRRCGDDKQPFQVITLFAASDVIRSEARYVVEQLKARNIQTWMITGDNEVTAKAVASRVGIAPDHVIAGVLPQEKAEKVVWLQKTASSGSKPGILSGRYKKERSIVAMVGDGINDAPPLSAADVGIAIGSGSDIALSSAKFVLMSNQLTQILTLFDISSKVLRRVKFNFFWAGIYNMIGIPVAAGVLYPIHHARLAPAWASLAMALSSVSVVCSSLALKLYKPPKFESKS
ncbi:hypothetical protein V1511DRAFT_461517 [Dipodascopsis uninucleata]